MRNLSLYGLVLVMAATSWVAVSPARGSVFINEIHYDNQGGDINEGVEIAGTAGQILSGWFIQLYNGNNGEIYESFGLSDYTIPDQQNGFGALFCPISGMQNGGPDGVALVDGDNEVLQFLSYEGSFTGLEEPASGITSVDIGVFEDGSLQGCSLQLTGTGTNYDDFTWTGPIAATPGQINTGQSFVPIPGAMWLLGSGLIGLLGIRNCRKRAHS